MIKANELRLNNWVYSQEIGDNVQISAISEDGFSFKKCVTWGYPNIEEIHPIPLTEEILLKCGFVKENLKPSNNHSFYYSIWIDDYKYSFSYANFRDDWGFYQSYTDALKYEDNNKFVAVSFGIKHIHQLQNLFYALTNEELQINL